ncbi:MoxR family ATPase [Alteribacter natronophilus]|nr:MoxR family ATPase [Alteribacter natronophilus]
MEQILKTVQQEVGKVLTGKDRLTEMVMISLISGGHILLEDVPGTGKTVMAKTIARLTDGTFKRLQFTPDVLPGDVTGVQFFNPKTREFEMRPGPVMTNILLADEINRATPRTQSSLLEVMEESQVTIDGTTLPLPQPFIVIATQNPVESQQGTFSLPEAQMDRFLMQIKAGYPTPEEEKAMIRLHKGRQPFEDLKPVIKTRDLLDMKKQAGAIDIHEPVENYLLNIIQGTRQSEDTEIGVSPRGTLVFIRAVQAKALLAGRTYATPDDVKTLAPAVLGHRLVLTLESSMTKTKEEVLAKVLKDTPAPVEEGYVRK